MGDPGEPRVLRDPVSRSGWWAGGMLIGLAIVAWAATIHWGIRMGSMRGHAQPMGAAFFLVMWGVMQAAMMFPGLQAPCKQPAISG
jgi:predicted metal-binding membrane protein